MGRLTPRVRRRRTGRLLVRRSRAQRASIAVVSVAVLGAVWLWVPSLALRTVLTAVLLLALPMFVVIALDRRS